MKGTVIVLCIIFAVAIAVAVIKYLFRKDDPVKRLILAHKRERQRMLIIDQGETEIVGDVTRLPEYEPRGM